VLEGSVRKAGNRILLSMLGIVLLASMVAACTGSNVLTSPPQTSAGGQGTLNLADNGPITLDPATAAEASSAMYIFQLFSGLLRLDENLQVAPDIASSWDKSADGKTFTFHLRQDVKFHDGKPVKASDFKYSWERALNPATQSLTAGTYLNDIVGAEDVLSGKTSQLSGVKVLDDYTLQVAIKSPVAYFLEKMAFPTPVLSRKRLRWKPSPGPRTRARGSSRGGPSGIQTPLPL
jgi:oligopeptide transport system substrate-binding protein